MQKVRTSQVLAATCSLMVVRGIYVIYSLCPSGPEHFKAQGSAPVMHMTPSEA